MVISRILLAIAIAGTASCSYSTSFVDCEVACTIASGCPDGFTCSLAEGLCRSSGATTASCAESAPGVDAAVPDDVVAVDSSTNPCAGVSVPSNCSQFVCGGTCHLYCTTPSNWEAAKAACESVAGWSLTEIDSLAESTCVDGQIPDGTNTWIGLHQAAAQTAVDANWSWSRSGTAIPPSGTAFRLWESDAGTGSAPNDAGGAGGEDGSQQCASTSGDASGWDDRECPQTISYVCERFL